jgi:hypothetical protein
MAGRNKANRRDAENAEGVTVKVGNGLATNESEISLVPSYTLRADNPIAIFQMICIARIAKDMHAPAEKVAELEALVREFELYEEAHRDV